MCESVSLKFRKFSGYTVGLRTCEYIRQLYDEDTSPCPTFQEFSMFMCLYRVVTAYEARVQAEVDQVEL